MLLWTAVLLGWVTLALGGGLLLLALVSPLEAGPSRPVRVGKRVLRATAGAWALVLLWIILDILATWVGR